MPRLSVLERTTLAEYDPFNNTFTSIAYPFVALPLGVGVPSQVQFHSPVFGNDGYLYVFAGLSIARVPANPASWGNGSNYRWWTGTTWSTDMTQATSVVPGFSPLGITVNDFSQNTSHKYVMLAQTGFATAEFKLYEATSLTGPWTAGRAGRVPDVCAGGGFGCYALIAHPELSTNTKLVYSWLSPGDRNGAQHLRLGDVGW
jgi:hypothetical protein